MAFREIVVHVDDSDSARARVQQALRLAAKHEAHLVALYVVDIPVLAGYATVDVPAEVFTLQREAWLKRAEAAKSWFEEVAASSGVTTEWRQDEGATVDRLCLSARRADLLMVGLAQEPQTSTGRQRATIARAVLSCGIPILITPDAGTAIDPGTFVTVGWDGGREAARAVHDALPILQQAQSVSIACVDPDTGGWAPHGDVPGADIAHWFARHGVTAQAQSVISGDKTTGETLLDWAKGQGSDLVVVGGYGHSRVRELMLGGVTRHLMQHATVPVLMSH